MRKPLLLLVDGHSLVHRGYHALPPLSVSRTGEPTQAVFGFASMLLKVLAEVRPSYAAVAFDLPGPTFRHLQFEAYKAQRGRPPEELSMQFGRVREVVDTLALAVFEAAGYEADDLLATLSRQAVGQGVEVLIVTGDTDALQLVGPGVRVLTSRGRFSDTVTYDETAVRQRYGLSPNQLADLRALRGDASDNIPGIPGIGDKTAQRLLAQFGTLEGIYEHLEEVEPLKLRALLRLHQEQARQSQALARLDYHAPVTLDLESCRLGWYDREKVVALFRELEFRTLLDRLPEPQVAPRLAQRIAQEYRVVDNAEALAQLREELGQKQPFALDVETTSRDPHQAALVGLSLATEPGRAFYLPVGHRDGGRQLALAQVTDALGPMLASPAVAKVAHNGKYDALVLERAGLPVRGLAFDTMIAAHLLGEKALGLKDLAFNRLGVEMTPITELLGTGRQARTMAEVPIEATAAYAAADADMTWRLHELFEAELRAQGLWQLFAEVEMPLLGVLLAMEQAGVAVDTTLLGQMSRELGVQLADLEVEIYRSVGHAFNLNSPRQLGDVLFGELRLPKGRKTKTGHSTAAAVLDDLRGAHPVIDLILEYRELSKLKSTYLDALPALVDPKTGRLHTTFNQTGTTTGRLSSAEPNLQNIPIRTERGLRVRRAFIARGDGLSATGGWWLVGADYSQIDLRVLAHLSQDERLLAAFHQDEDIHSATAAEVFGVAQRAVTLAQRRVAKTVNFGVIYGMSEFGLSQGLDLSREEAGRFIRSYFERYPGVRRYLDETKRRAAEQGYVETILGRRRYIPDLRSPNPQVRAAAERMAINMPVQGSSADIIKVAMVQLQQALEEQGLLSRMILQVHDELLFEAPEDELAALRSLVAQIMPRAIPLSIPLKIDIKVAGNWGDME